MSKTHSIYVCQQCGFQSPRFLGRCPECQAWGSLIEQVEEVQSAKSKTKNEKKGNKATIVNLADLAKQDYERVSTASGEFDRVLGGPARNASASVAGGGPPRRDGRVEAGIVPGSVILVAGDPGIGKSTLLLQLALDLNQSHKTNKSNKINVLYVAGEESARQIKIRAERIKPQASLDILNEVDADVICAVIEREKPNLVIIDSIQTLETEDLTGVAGSVGQVRECAHRLQKTAKRLHLPIFLVGHVTKEGSIAGPKTLEHLVDVVLSLEGDPTSSFRILRSSKNRFGPTDEVGVFEMTEQGMREVKNPSEVFLSHKVNAPGSAVAVTMNGFRPLLVEIQALTTKSLLPVPIRRGLGVDSNRLQLLTAVLQKRLGLPLGNQDIFVNVTGGLKVLEPAADLAVCMAIVSSLKDWIISSKTALIGEVGILGELRSVRRIEQRIKEAKKLGYTNVVSPENAKSLDQAVKKVLK